MTPAAQVLPSSLPKEGDPSFRHYVRQARWSWSGSAIMAIYVLAFLFYMWVRVTKTLDLGRYLPYGVLVLIIEIMGATTTLLYGVNLLRHPVNPPAPEDPQNPGLPKARVPSLRRSHTPAGALYVKSTARRCAQFTRRCSGGHVRVLGEGASQAPVLLPQVNAPYHIRVLVPCYKEDLRIVTDTLQVRAAPPWPVSDATCLRVAYADRGGCAHGVVVVHSQAALRRSFIGTHGPCQWHEWAPAWRTAAAVAQLPPHAESLRTLDPDPEPKPYIL